MRPSAWAHFRTMRGPKTWPTEWEHSVTSTRLLLPIFAVLMVTSTADAGGLFSRKGKSDARVKHLADTIRTDADEKKRRAAIEELKDADPRTQPDVIPVLVVALQRDSVPQVRAEAAEAIGQFKAVFPVAGAALESAAEGDPSPLVRDAAQQALWEYHLGGYRSARGADGIAGQTPEPPIARPGPARLTHHVRFPVAPPPLEPINWTRTDTPPRSIGYPISPPPAASTTVTFRIPETATALTRAPITSGVRIVLTAAPPLQLNVTDEPPIADRLEVAPPPRRSFADLPPPDLELPAPVPRRLPAPIDFPTIPPLPDTGSGAAPVPQEAVPSGGGVPVPESVK